MKHRSLQRIAALGLSLACFACGEQGPAGPRLEIQTSPLNLPNVENVCYGLTVYNDDPDDLNVTPETVWSQPGICSVGFGNRGGGDITYIGTCDADPNGRLNYVSLVIESVTVETNTLLTDQFSAAANTQPDFQNPCPASDPCVLPEPCFENEDRLVVFDITVMRRAHQGFFDVAVNFEDIFCSAKVDTCYPGVDNAPDSPIRLLFGYADDDAQAAGELQRGHTAVVAVACTAGPNNTDATHIYMTQLDVSCLPTQFDNDGNPLDGASFGLDPSLGNGGNVFPTPGTFTSGAIWQYAIYEGTESLDCDGTPCDKVYWNVAFGIEGLPANCQLDGWATATQGALTNGTIPVGHIYPRIWFHHVPLTDSAGNIICDQHPLGSTYLEASYLDLGPFGYELSQDGNGGVVTQAIPGSGGGGDGGAGGGGDGGGGGPPMPDFLDLGLATTNALVSQDFAFGDPATARYAMFELDTGSVGFSFLCTSHPTATWQISGPFDPPDTLWATGDCDGSTIDIDAEPGIYAITIEPNADPADGVGIEVQAH